jgi:hypothetical protein
LACPVQHARCLAPANSQKLFKDMTFPEPEAAE